MLINRFKDFLSKILDGSLTVEEWNAHALKKSSDPSIEAMRRQLVDYALNNGQCSWRPIPVGIETLARDLLDELNSDELNSFDS